MGVIKFLRDISGVFNWNTDDNPTSELTYMNAVKNWQETEKNLVDTVLWQPTTAYSVGNVVKTPSLPSQQFLVCTTAGTSGANEPSYSSVSVGDSVTDGSVTWMVSSHFTQSMPTDSSVFGIFGGTTSSSGAYLLLYGKDFVTARKGCFELNARNSTESGGTSLFGAPDGTLTWGGQPIQTSSDKRLKQDFSAVPDDVLDAWGKVEWQQFKYKADAEKKEHARYHVGLVAQDVEKSVKNVLDYGILCYDKENDLWTVRYTEALCMEVIYLRKKIADLESRLQAVENRG